MIRAKTAGSQSGLTLVELMIAMVLGLLVAAGIITVFLSTSTSNRVQTQMANLQEAGRFAVFRLGRDIGMTNAQYCSGSGGNAHPSASGPFLDGLRAPTVYAHSETGTMLLDALSDVTTPWGDPYPSKPSAVFSLPPYLSMRGYDCTKTTCSPEDPHTRINDIPGQGTAVGKRVIGTSILTLRYLDPSMGWRIGHPGGSSVTVAADGTLSQINLAPMAGEPPVSDFGGGDLAMLANCSTAQVFAVSGQGTTAIKPTGANFSDPSGQKGTKGLKLFDFDRAYKTVTYYVQVVDAGNGNTTGALMRRVNGDSAQEMVRGIERLDFRYGIIDANGNTQYLTANEVDTRKGGTIACPSNVSMPVDKNNQHGCLWRAIKSIEVDLLMDGQTPLYALTNDELGYTYVSDGITSPQGPDKHAIKPHTDQGFPKFLLRREFTALIAVRNYNP